MAAIINDRDILLQATSPRLLSVTLPSNITVVDAVTALSTLTQIASDNVLSKGEKPPVIGNYTAITNEQAGIDSSADTFSISRTAYDSAVSALTTYLAGLSPAYNDVTQDTTIVGTTFRANFNAVYTARQALLNAIDARIITTGYIADNAATDIANLSATSVSLTNQNTAASEPTSYTQFQTILSYSYTATFNCQMVATVVSKCHGQGTSGSSLAGGPAYFYRDRIDINETFSTSDSTDSIPALDGSSTPLSSSVVRDANQSKFRVFSLTAGQSVTVRYRISSNDYSFMAWTAKTAMMNIQVIKK